MDFAVSKGCSGRQLGDINMPNDLRIRVSSLVSIVAPAGITDAQMSSNIADYCEAMGIDLSGGNQADLDNFSAHLWNEVRRVARAHRKRKKQAAAGASIDAEIDTELGT